MSNNPWGLTPREIETMTLLTECGCSKQVADRMGVSGKTVDKFVVNAMRRIGARTRMQVVVMWDRSQRPTREMCEIAEAANESLAARLQVVR